MKEWHLNRIPKLMFGFWGTQEFPWVRYLTLETFRKHHPDWQMILYHKPILDNYGNDYQGKSYWDKLDNLGVEVREIDVEKEMGVKFPNPYITIFADTMRYVALNWHGGFYIDLDNLFFRSLEDMPWNSVEHVNKDVFILTPPFHHIILGVQGSGFYNKVLEIQKTVLSGDPSKILDTTGCTMRVQRAPQDKVALLPLIVTEENFGADGPKSEWALALNWHGSGTYGKYQGVTEETYMDSDHPLAGIIRYCLHGSVGKSGGLGTFEWIVRDDLGW